MLETLGVLGAGALDLLGTGVSGAASVGAPFGGDFIKGSISNYWNKKALKQSYKYAYDYAERYARNSPTWNVEGLRAAGLNPILAVSKGFGGGSPSSVSSPSVDTNSRLTVNDNITNELKRNERDLTKEQLKSAKIDNQIKVDTRNTLRAENEVKRLRAQAESEVLKPELKYQGEPKDGKQIDIYVKSEGFKALQKAIRDDFDLRSEKYMRETIDAVMRYGTDVLKLLPMFRRKELIDTLQKTIKTGPNGKTTTYETYTTHAP